MNKKIFIAIDTRSTLKATHIIRKSRVENFKIGYKFGLEFINSKKGRKFISNLKNSIIFIDLKLHDIPNTISSTLKSLITSAIEVCVKINFSIKIIDIFFT